MTQRSPQYPRDSRGEQTGVNRSTDGHFIGHRGDDGAIEYGFDVGCGEGSSGFVDEHDTARS